MKDFQPENRDDELQLHVVSGAESIEDSENQMRLEEERLVLEERAATEDYWAGHHPANRVSTRRAA